LSNLLVYISREWGGFCVNTQASLMMSK